MYDKADENRNEISYIHSLNALSNKRRAPMHYRDPFDGSRQVEQEGIKCPLQRA